MAAKKTQVIPVGSQGQGVEAAAEAAAALKAGKLVGFATETVYGIAAVASNADAMRRLRKLKSRPKEPFSVLVAGADDAGRYVRCIPPAARRLMQNAWPGPVTLLLETEGHLADEQLERAGLHEVLCSGGVIGLRCPDDEVALRMIRQVDDPVVAPSANLAGKQPPRDADAVLADLDGKIDLLIDSGPCRHGRGSTIVRFGADGWDIVRPGAMDERKIRQTIRRTIIFVCTGNTCRSAMAGGIAKVLLARREGVSVGDLRKNGIFVSSAGIWGIDGCRATPEAIRAARGHGADISKHRSRKLTMELINSSDLVSCMTGYHVEEVRCLVPTAGEKVRRLAGNRDIPDPIGGGADVYCRTADRIEKAIAAWLNKEAI